MRPELALAPARFQKGSASILYIAQKAEIELTKAEPVARAAIVAHMQTIETKGQARDYFDRVRAKVNAYKAVKLTE